MTDHDLDPIAAMALARAADLVELGEVLAFLSGWLASDPDLEASLTRFTGDRAYDLYRLRVDLDRFAFVVGADHDEPPLPRHPLVKETSTT